MLLLLVFLAGTAWAAPEPRAASEASSVRSGSFDVLSWAWEWLTSLVSDDGTISSGGGHLSGSEGGMFIDPNGNS
jgi:hypothetical protein